MEKRDCLATIAAHVLTYRAHIRRLGALLLVLLAPMQAQANVLEFDFTGTLFQSYSLANGGTGAWDGQVVSGRLTFDPTSQPVTQTDGSTILWQQQLAGPYFGKSYSPPYVSLSLTLPDSRTLTNSGRSASQSETMVLRNWGGTGLNKLSISVTSRDEIQQGDLTLYQNYVSAYFQFYDYQGVNSTLFTAANGGLRYDQPINLGIAEQESYFSFVDQDVTAGPPNFYSASSYGNIAITSFQLAVPEPSNYALMLIGLCVLARAVRHRRGANARFIRPASRFQA